MNAENLFLLLSKSHPISEEFKYALEKELVHLSLPKNFHLLEAPRVADHSYFLEDGFAMAYAFLDGKRQVEGFWKSRQIILSGKSFFEGVASQEFIQLMIPSEVLCLSKASVMKLYDHYPESHVLTRMIMNQYYEEGRMRVREFQFSSAAERFQKLLRMFPHIEQWVSQEHIASYIGITPQSLARLKREENRS